MTRGQPILDAAHQRYLAEREAIVVTARCALCDWHQEGTVLETREAHHAHRHTEHPELKPKPRRKRHRKYGQLSGFKSLDDNIAEARKSGAASWAGPE